MKILKKIGSIVLDVLIVIVFIVSTLVVIATVTAKRENGQANVFGYTVNSVQTDSMKGSIDEGDLVVSKVITDANREEIVLEKGNIISFYTELEDETKILITHRIVEIEEIGGTLVYTTWGDNRESAPAPDAPLTIYEIQSVYQFKIPFAGKFIDFLRTPLGFIVCLVVPLLAFIAFQAYKLISLYLKAKKLELVEEANNASKSAQKTELSDEEKNAIIAEYLAKQALEKQAAEEKSANEAKSEDKEESKPEEESASEEKSETLDESVTEESKDSAEESDAKAEENVEAEEENVAEEKNDEN